MVEEVINTKLSHIPLPSFLWDFNFSCQLAAVCQAWSPFTFTMDGSDKKWDATNHSRNLVDSSVCHQATYVVSFVYKY